MKIKRESRDVAILYDDDGEQLATYCSECGYHYSKHSGLSVMTEHVMRDWLSDGECEGEFNDVSLEELGYVHLRDRLYDVAYLIRCWDVGDDEEGAIEEGGYLELLPDPIRSMALSAIHDMGSCRLAIQIFCLYWLRIALHTSPVLWPDCAQYWFDNDWVHNIEPSDVKWIADERRRLQEWISIGKQWSYFR